MIPNFWKRIDYQPYSQIVERIQAFDNVTVIGKDQSYKYDMYMIELGNPENPTLFMTASLHGSEWQGTIYNLDFLEQLRDDTYPDKELRDRLLNEFHIAAIPVVNPWGYVDTYPEAIVQGRYNSRGADLNRDFHDFSERESQNVRDQMLRFKPFAYLDSHLIRSSDKLVVVGNGQYETDYLKEKWIQQLEDYLGFPVTSWEPYANMTRGLSRRFMRDQDNPHTTHTLSYITEIVRPVNEHDGYMAPLSSYEIYKVGMADIHLFFKTSLEYYDSEQKQRTINTQPHNPDNGLTVYDKDLNPIGKLNNVFDISIERRANEIWSASFSMPLNDPKNELCHHFNYIDIYGDSGRYYGKYRIMPTETKKDENNETITYKLEHVLSTLLDDVILDYAQLDGLPTKESLEAILSQQTTQNWVLGRCDFERFFSYAFENENGLLAPVLSVPKPFNEPYLFTFDTESYPWKLNLISPSDDVMWDMRWGRDMISFDDVSDPSEIVNRIYPKGYGEGVNQLTIEGVNNGVPYVEDVESIQKWGLHQYIWIDKRFEDAESLKANAEGLLNEWKDPKISFKVQSVDLSIKDEFKHLERPFYSVGNIIVGDKTYQARIIGEKISDLSKEYDVDYEINNKLDDIADLQTDVERKQQINDAYSQGATNIMNTDRVDNADPAHPIKFLIRIPEDAINVNFMELTWETNYFRAYSRAIKGGGATVTSTEAGGGVSKTTSSGGGTQTSTASGGGSSQTSSSGGGTSTSTQSGGGTSRTTSSTGTHRHRVFGYSGEYGDSPNSPFNSYHAPRNPDGSANGLLLIPGAAGDVYTESADGAHSHSVSIPSHSHNFSVPNHRHTVSIPNHTHDVSIPSHRHDIELDPHTHEITLPDHTHEIEYGIHEHNSLPSSLEIKVDGTVIDETRLEGENLDLIPYLQKDESGKIQRNRYAVVEIRPKDELAQITATIVWGVFIQSRKGVTL